MHPALPIAAASLPLQAFNVQQVARRKPGRTPTGQALEELSDAFTKRVDQVSPGRGDIEIGLELNTPDKSPMKTFLDRDTSKFASNSRTDDPKVYNVDINPNADRSYLAHELGHVVSDQTDIGHFIRSARGNKALSRSLGAAALLGAGGSAALTAGDDDLTTSIALAYAGSLPTIADEFLASKNALAILDTADMRATMGQRGRLAGGLLSYAAAPLLAGAGLNFAGNLIDEDPVQTDGTLMP